MLSPQPEGGDTVTVPLLPELVTEGDTAEETPANIRNALAVVIETYRDLQKPLAANLRVQEGNGAVWLETMVGAP